MCGCAGGRPVNTTVTSVPSAAEMKGALMLCRTCPGLLEKAAGIIEQTEQYDGSVLPPDEDWTAVRRALRRLADAYRNALIREGRWP